MLCKVVFPKPNEELIKKEEATCDCIFERETIKLFLLLFNYLDFIITKFNYLELINQLR